MNDTESPQRESARTYRIPRQRLSLVRDGSIQSTWKHFANSLEVSRSVGMKLTGHETESVYRWYAIVSKSDLEEAARRLDDFDGKALAEISQNKTSPRT